MSYQDLQKIINQKIMSISALILSINIYYTEIPKSELQKYQTQLERDYISITWLDKCLSIELDDVERFVLSFTLSLIMKLWPLVS